MQNLQLVGLFVDGSHRKGPEDFPGEEIGLFMFDLAGSGSVIEEFEHDWTQN